MKTSAHLSVHYNQYNQYNQVVVERQANPYEAYYEQRQQRQPTPSALDQYFGGAWSATSPQYNRPQCYGRPMHYQSPGPRMRILIR